jgi:DNA-binding transcriptional ArsR family regulator
MYRMEADRCDLLCLDLPKAEDLRTRRLSPGAAASGAAEAAALADPTRLTIAAALAAGGELCVCDLAWVAERAENLVSHHLRVLREVELVASRREGKMVLYELTGRGQMLLDELLSEGVGV